jgi:Peptidase family M1 domain
VRKLFLFLIASTLCLKGFAQYWQQQVNYLIDVTLHFDDKTLDAFENITYINNSPDTLHFIWFHLWPNAYKNDRTAFSEQLLENGTTRFYFSDKDQKGYINRLLFKVNGTIASTEEHPESIDIIKVLLPEPLLPHQSVAISTPFHEKLPFNVSRGGYDGETFQITQWYPKPAVYDRTGWHPMPYLDQGEFYSEFGNFDVRITLPEPYKVAASGVLQSTELLSQTEKSSIHRYITHAGHHRLNSTYGHQPTPAETDSIIYRLKTVRFTQEQIHDFAWFANKDFIERSDTCQLPSGNIVHIFSYYTPSENRLWDQSISYAKDALRFYSEEIREYPYRTLRIVQGPKSFGGGMEYPTITVISPLNNAKALDETITHEIGHNWFYGVLATNERDHPWMDEGITTFYEQKYVNGKYGPQPRLTELIFQSKVKHRTDQPIEIPAPAFSKLNYALIAYYKTAQFMEGLEKRLGETTFRRRMQAYYDSWKFKHPYPEDLQDILAPKQMEDSSLRIYFQKIQEKGLLPDETLKGTAFLSPFIPQTISRYLLQPTRHAFLFTPVVGYNSYDKLMPGLFITNYKLPPDNFQFFVAPLYATGTNRFTGIGKLNYSFHTTNKIRKTDLFLNGSSFTMNSYQDSAGKRSNTGFKKLVPGVRFTFNETNPRSTASRFLQWKTYLIQDYDSFARESHAPPYRMRYLNQLKYVSGNFRALYPYDVALQIEQSNDFIRPTITGNYFFNYAAGGGLQVRFFAGKFIYIGDKIEKRYRDERYFLNMSGPNGYEDYTYSYYYLGRNRFDGIASQQIAIRDGGFKIRTELLADKIGKTDNWLAAVNLKSSLVSNFHLPSGKSFSLPLYLFCDVGTYAEAWDKNANTGRFLYDAGVQLSVLKGSINIYVPVLYSKVYADYFTSYLPAPRFLQTISFSIDLDSRNLKNIQSEIEF